MQKNISTLIEELLTLADKTAEVQLEIINLTEKMSESDRKIEDLETTIRASIANQVDDAGKKKYSNADARDAAFIELTKHDLEINSLKETSRSLKKEIAIQSIEVDRLKNRQRNIRSVITVFSLIEEM